MRLALFAIAFMVHAQSFDAAAIHPNPAGAAPGSRFNVFDGSRLHVVNSTLLALIGHAWNIQSDQIVGGPAWLDSERFDIDAKPAIPETPNADRIQVMIRNLLAERFDLRVHRETRERTFYALVTAKSGPKLKDHDGGPGSTLDTRTDAGKISLTGANASMQQLAQYLGNKLGRVVLDKTGLTGSYDFTFEWDPEQAADSASPTMFTGLQQQLGLRLETQKGAVEVLVIDNAARPSPN